MNDLKKVQELNLKLLKKEQKEYDHLLDLEEDTTKHYKNRISKENGCVFVAIVNKKVIGYLCGKLAKTGSFGRLPSVSVAEIETFFVLDKFRSKGIGKRLYAKFIEWCKIKKVNKARLDVHPQNKLALKFYRKNNFRDYYLTLEKDF